MADFVSVLRRAVGNLENNTEAARQAIYGKARAALRAQLEAIDPPLGPDEITRQIQGLDQAVTDLEAELAASGSESATESDAAPKQDTGAQRVGEPESVGPAPVPSTPQAAAPSPTPVPAPPATPQPPAAPQPASPEPTAATPKPHQTFQAAVSETSSLGGAASTAAREARETLDRIGSDSDEDEGYPGDAPVDPYSGRREPDMAGSGTAPGGGQPQAEAPPLADAGRHPQPTSVYDEEDGEERGGSGRFVAWIILFLVLAGIVGVGFWQRDTVMEIAASFTGNQDTAEGTDGKIADRVPGANDAGQQSDTTPTAETPAPAPLPGAGETGTPPSAADADGERVAQALLIEESAGGVTPGSTLGGSVDWALVDDTEAVGGVEKVIQGKVNVPEKGLGVTVTIRRNADQALPASHLIELVFETGPDFTHGGIGGIPGIIMKATPRSTGQPLVGAVVPVMDGYYLVGLSESEIDRARNVAELTSRDFIDIPISYKDGGRAVLSLAKGETGNRVFNEAFAVWDQ